MAKKVITGLLVILHMLAGAQPLVNLQKEKEKAEREIEITTRLLSQAEQKEKASLSNLQLINNNISQRNKIISGLNSEIRLYDEFIGNNTLADRMLTEDIEKMKAEYAKLLRLTYLSGRKGSNLMFLLSAESFNQAYRRMLYMRRYSAVRNEQAVTIKSLQQLLIQKAETLKKLKETRLGLLNEAKIENQKLDAEKRLQNREIQELKKQQNDLRRKLEQQRKIEQQLEREIQRIVEEEAKKNREAGEPAYALTPEQKLTGESFEQNRQKLPWPVERGVITERFGIQRHPVLQNVQIRNNGINIATEPDSKVRAVFNGEVSRVFAITGGNSAIIIRHGNYLTVYSNLREINVKKGDRVSTYQNIGTVYSDADDAGKSILKFQVWRESEKLNPEEWISR